MAQTQAELRAKIDALILALRADREADRQVLADLQASRADPQASGDDLLTTLQACTQEVRAWRQEQQENLANLQSAVNQLKAAWDKLHPVLIKLKAKQPNPTQPNPPQSQPSPMTDWITDRLPTEADADEDGDVIFCSHPNLDPNSFLYEKWHLITPGWPWRHTTYWTPPTPQPEPTPAAPKPKPKKATRGFLAFTRVYYSKDFVDFVDCVVATDNTAWVRHSANFTHWEQVAPLPQPGEE